MITWGAVGNSHDASLAIFKNDNLMWAALAKDFSNTPNDPHLNHSIISVALEMYGHPDKIHWYERPLLKTIRQWSAGQGWLLKENNIRDYFHKRHVMFTPIKYTSHHHSHAAYAYYTQRHSDCAVLCLDSIGEFECLTIWHGNNGKLRKKHTQTYPNSLGLFYSAITQRVGLVPQRDEHLIMEYAAKGDRNRLFGEIIRELVDLSDVPNIRMRENFHRGCLWWRPELTSQQDMYDIAAATQYVFEACVGMLTRWARRITGANHLAITGGGALNKGAVDRIRPDWDSVWVPHNPGDPGSCIGAVLAQTKKFTSLDDKWHNVICTKENE